MIRISVESYRVGEMRSRFRLQRVRLIQLVPQLAGPNGRKGRESWIVKESRGKAYGKHERVKGLPRRRNFQDQQESNRALFIVFHRTDYLSSPVRRQLYPAGEELRGLSLRLVNRLKMTQTGHWQFKSLRHWLSFRATRRRDSSDGSFFFPARLSEE